MPLQRTSSSREEAADRQGSDRRRALAGLRVLLVEDDADGREALAVALRSAGVQVSAVASSGDALHAIGECPPDVLVSDIGLPLEDGYVLIRKVRALEASRGGVIPAIALTAYTGAQDRARALAAGYQAHVAKPIDPAQLLAVLANFRSRENSSSSACHEGASLPHALQRRREIRAGGDVARRPVEAEGQVVVPGPPASAASSLRRRAVGQLGREVEGERAVTWPW